MVTRDTAVGRDAELAVLEEELSGARAGLVLVVGEPRIGKSHLLRALRWQAAARGTVVVPEDADSDGEWVSVDKQMTIEDFRRKITSRLGSIGSHRDELGPEGVHLVLVYGYRPHDEFHAWFTHEFVPGLADGTPRRVVVVSGTAPDLANLAPLAHRQIFLGPLPRAPVVAELRALNERLADRMSDVELQAYADAVTTDPGLLDAFIHLLPMTGDRTTGAGKRGDDSG